MLTMLKVSTLKIDNHESLVTFIGIVLCKDFGMHVSFCGHQGKSVRRVCSGVLHSFCWKKRNFLASIADVLAKAQ